jgi:UDP-N-acetylglucosamine--dolichyl-phosphate N-acetylglucosaminephosphotransferase
MPEILTLITVFISFFVTVSVLPYWIKRACGAKLVSKDVHKTDGKNVAELGGLAVVAGFLVGTLSYIGTKVFYFHIDANITAVFATISAILIATVIGLVDDILGWKIGLRARYKVILTFFIALPVMVINAGEPTMYVPLLGMIDFGLLYPLLLIPLAVMGTSNGFNMIAGYNGLEAGMGIIILSTLGFISYLIGASFVAVLAFTMVASLLGFFFYNKYPAKIFPGDTLTYSVGALIAIIAILMNIEKFALVLFVPYFMELALKLRGKLKKESFADVADDGTLKLRYDKWYGLEHVAISVLKKCALKTTEKNVVYSLYAFQLLFAGLSITYYFL